MENLRYALFWLSVITIIAELVLCLALIVSIKAPPKRIWPPPAKQSWQYWLIWITTSICYLGLGGLALLNWNSFIFPNWVRYLVGLPLLIAGLSVAFWGSGVLGWKRTSGQQGGLKTTGLYRYSRNPQYLGNIINFFGLAVFSNATLILIPALLASLLFAFWPLSEEPWLKDRFGKGYEDYCKQVPRFI